MIVTGKMGVPLINGHCGYVAGRYRDGLFTDTWTDVSRCARGTFVGFAPVCTCGWQGEVQSATAGGLRTCEELLVADHLGGLDHVHAPVMATLSTLRVRGIARAPVSARFQAATG